MSEGKKERRFELTLEPFLFFHFRGKSDDDDEVKIAPIDDDGGW
jgi:hypothetical protein